MLGIPKPRGGPARPSPSPVRQAAQDWLPIADLHDGCLIRPDGAAVGGIALGTVPLSLRSESERRAAVAAVQAALATLADVDHQWLSVFRPVDLDGYMRSLDELHGRTTDPVRRRVLADYISWVTGRVASGEAVERRHHLLVVRTGRDAVAEHRTQLPALADDLRRVAGLRADVMDDAAWRDLLFLAFHAAQAAVEPVPDGLAMPPVFRGGCDR